MSKPTNKVIELKKVTTRAPGSKKIAVDTDVSSSGERELEYSDIRWLMADGSPFIPDTSTLSLADYYKMTKDYQIAACINTIAFTIQQIDWNIKSKDKKVQDFCTFAMEGIWKQLINGISQSFWAGFSPMIKVFTEVDRGPWKGKIIIKRLKDLYPTGVSVRTDNDGTFNGIKIGENEIDLEYCFWYTFLMKNGNFYGTYLLEPAYMPYFYSQVVHLFANRYYERFGEPVVEGRYPLGQTVKYNGIEMDAADFMEELVNKIRNHTSIALPSTKDEDGNEDWMLKFLESNIRGADFETYMKRLDMEKARAIFVPELLFGTGRVGSYKLGDRHTNTFLTLLNSLIDDIKEHIDKHILRQLVDFNFGADAEPATFEPERLGRSNTEMLTTILREMVRQGTVKVSVKELSQRIGMEIKEVRQLVQNAGLQNEVVDNPKKDTGKGSKQTAAPAASATKKLKKKDFFSKKFNGKDLTKREESVNFEKLQDTYDEFETEIKVALVAITKKQKERIKKTVERLYNEGKVKDLDKVKIGYRGSYEKEWKSSLLALFIIGAEEEIKRSGLEVENDVLISKDERQVLADNASMIAKLQLDGLENKVRSELLRASDLSLPKSAAIALAASIFTDFIAKDGELDKSIQRAVVWGVRQGKVAVAERSQKVVSAKVWSAVLDDKTCPLCEELHGMYIPADSSAFTQFVPPVHWRCRCEEILIYDDEPKGEDEKPFKKPSKELVKRYGGLISV